MSSHFEIRSIHQDDYCDLSIMVGELLNGIMDRIDAKVFSYNKEETEERAKELVSEGKYWVFIARETDLNINVGFVSLYESYSLYSEGAYGTMPELFVREDWRSQSVGKRLLDKVWDFALNKGWSRIEVTTPPLPEFNRALNFYQKNGFEISGGRKLKMDINA